MAEFRSGAGTYKKSLENLLMPDVEEVLNIMDQESVTYHWTQESACRQRGYTGQI